MAKSRSAVRAFIVFVVILLVSGSAMAQSAMVPGPHTNVPEGTTEDAHRIHAEAYAEDRGIDIEEASRRLALQARVMELSSDLMTHEPDFVAGVRIEHVPDLHVIVFVLPGGQERVRPYVEDGPLRDLVTFEVVERTKEQLRADLEHADELLLPYNVQYGAAITEREVQIFVLDAESLEQRLRADGVVLPASVRIVDAVAPDSDDATVIGGFALSTGCTSGFAGRYASSTPIKGFFTAGHCNGLTTNPARFSHIPGVDFAYYAQFLGGSSDFQLHYHQPAHDLRSMINVGTDWIPITGLY